LEEYTATWTNTGTKNSIAGRKKQLRAGPEGTHSREAFPKLKFWESNFEICSFVRLKA
jgi:hypothetical protein